MNYKLILHHLRKLREIISPGKMFFEKIREKFCENQFRHQTNQRSESPKIFSPNRVEPADAQFNRAEKFEPDPD